MCSVLSLSLSLSQIDCAIAPKARKSIPARNLLQGFGSSSSFDPLIPFHVWFRDEKSQKDFSENFHKCGVHSKHQVILSDFVNTPLPVVIWTWGWESLLERPMSCPVMFIQEFYYNIHSIDTSVPQFASTFKGTRIVVTSNLISEVLHVPKVAHLDYPGCECL